MPPSDTIYAFFVRAEERSVAVMIDTSSDEKWQNNIRRAVNNPNAEVVLVREGEWEAPKLKSVEQGVEACVEGIQKYFSANKLRPMSQGDFAREHLGDMKSAMTGLMVILISHN
ncbi:MAG: hypothetical protein AB1564_07015 [Chloroflexota bacterium]